MINNIKMNAPKPLRNTLNLSFSPDTLVGRIGTNKSSNSQTVNFKRHRT